MSQSRKWSQIVPPVAGAVGLLALTLWPARLPWVGPVGDPLGETDNHVWMFWLHTERLLGGGEALANVPEGIGVPLMDLVNWPVWMLGAPLGPALAWNLMMVFSVALALFGGWRLGREVGGEAGAWVGMAGLGTAPFLAGVVDFGISESWPIGWLALHLALLLSHARSGRRLDALGAGLCLGAFALSGWYHALFGLVMEALVVPVLLWRHRRLGLLLQGGVALAMVLPIFAVFRGELGLWSHRWMAPSPGPPGPREDWATLPVFGTDLLNLVLPSTVSVHPSKAVYLGSILLLLVGVGLVRRGRRTLPWVLAALPLLALALGYWPTAAGKALGFPGPAYALVQLVPELQGLSHWHRAVGGALPALIAAAACGAAALPKRAWVGPLLALLIGVDAVGFGQTAWPRTVIEPELPEVFAWLDAQEGESREPDPRGIVQLPFDNDRRLFADSPARIYNRWQVLHGRPVSEHYEGMDALLASSKLVAAANDACWNQSRLPPYYAPPPEMRDLDFPTDPEVIEAERAQLRGWGYRWIVLHRDRCRLLAKPIQGLDRTLGEGERVGEQALVWEL